MSSNITLAIAAIEMSIREAQRYCDQYHQAYHDESDLANMEYYVERSFSELLVLLDHLALRATYERVNADYAEAKKTGFDQTDEHEGDFYPKWTGRVRMIADAVASTYGLAKTAQSEVHDLKAMLKRAVYAICDVSVFPKPPGNEADVHRRLETILKCHYPDLKSKPVLTKPIKNFEPDTGIPSAKTLLEYKFISNKAEAKRVADEILADASGYRSRDWANLLFVIYETNRVLPEDEWRNLLQDCDLYEGFDAIVLSGVGYTA